MNPPGIFVVGTDTGVGKTRVASLLIRSMRARGLRVGALKLVATGAKRNAAGEFTSDDTEALIAALGEPLEPRRVTPILFEAPLAPCVAARIEGTLPGNMLGITSRFQESKPGGRGPALRPPDSESGVQSGGRSTGPQPPRVTDGRREVITDLFLRADDLDAALAEAMAWWSGRAEVMVVEGVGGLLCPLAEGTTVADLAVVLDYPLMIVGRRGLGTLNHCLLTIEAARLRDLRIAGVVLNSAEPLVEGLAEATNAEELARRCPGISVLAELGFDENLLLPKSFHEVDWLNRAMPSRQR